MELIATTLTASADNCKWSNSSVRRARIKFTPLRVATSESQAIGQFAGNNPLPIGSVTAEDAIEMVPHQFSGIAVVTLSTVGLVGGVALGWYGPMAGDDAALLQVPTIIAIVLLVATVWRGWLSVAAFTGVAAFLGLHTVASYYGYCNVPYDDWLESLAGIRLGNILDSDRNHFDRLLHFAYGLLLWLAAREWAERAFQLSGLRASWIAVEFILATSAIYEIAEWLIAVFMAPEIADRYNGQQGDLWDAQKDMALAACGAILAAAVFHLAGRRDLCLLDAANSSPVGTANRSVGRQA